MINTLIYTASCILLSLAETKSYQPDTRYGHTSTFINEKLYILGGAISLNNKTSPRETFLYLDFSIPFSTNSSNWTELSSNNLAPSHIYAAAVKGGANNNTLFLYGGDSVSGQTTNLVHIFDTQSNMWSVPKITGTPPIGKVSITPTIDNNELIYLYGGATTYYNGIYVNDMFILDSIYLSWKKASSINAPSRRIDYGAVLLPNKNIIYIGGYDSIAVGALTLGEVYLYDTISDTWATKATSGAIPSARSAFSSVLGLDGQRVILFGGFGNNEEILSPTNSLYVLKLNNFSWYTPKVSGKIPLTRAHHRTNVIRNYMVITFGLGYTQGIENDVLLLDISSNDEYIWTTSFEPLLPASPSFDLSSPSLDLSSPSLDPSSPSLDPSSPSLDPSSPSLDPSSPSLVPSSTTVTKHNTNLNVVVIGVVVIGVNLIIVFVCILRHCKTCRLPRYNSKDKELPAKGRDEEISIPVIPGETGEISNLGQEIENQELETVPYNNQKPLQNQGQEIAMNNDKNSLPNFKDEALEALREEIIKVNLSQSSQYNDQVDFNAVKIKLPNED